MANNNKKKKEEQSANGVAKTAPTSADTTTTKKSTSKNMGKILSDATKRTMAGQYQRRKDGTEYTAREVQTRNTVKNLYEHKDNTANASRATSTTRMKTVLPEATNYENKVKPTQAQKEEIETKKVLAKTSKESDTKSNTIPSLNDYDSNSYSDSERENQKSGNTTLKYNGRGDEQYSATSVFENGTKHYKSERSGGIDLDRLSEYSDADIFRAMGDYGIDTNTGFGVLNYLKPGAMQDYNVYNTLYKEWAKRQGFDKDNEQLYQQAEDYAKEHPVLGSVGSVLSNFLSAGDATNIVENLLNGQALSADDGVRMSEVTNKLRSGATSDMGNVGKNIYNIGMSIPDSLTMMAPGGTAVMGLGAGANTLYDALDKGDSATQALALGALSGGIETATEKYELESLLNSLASSAINSGKDILLNMGKQALNEGASEGASEILNSIADSIISGKNSDFNNTKNYYLSQGYSEQEAEAKAFNQILANTGMSALGGALSGGLMGGAGSVGNYALNNSDNIINNIQNKVDTLSPEKMRSKVGQGDVPSLENIQALIGNGINANVRNKGADALVSSLNERTNNRIRNVLDYIDLDGANTNVETQDAKEELANAILKSITGSTDTRLTGNQEAPDIESLLKQRGVNVQSNNETQTVSDKADTSRERKGYSDSVPANVRTEVDNYLNNSPLSESDKTGIETAINKYYETGVLHNIAVAENIADTSKQTTAEISDELPDQNVSNSQISRGKIEQKPVETNSVENVSPKEIESLNALENAVNTDRALSQHYGNLERNSTESMVENQLKPNKSEFEHDVKHNADTKAVGESRLETDGDDYWNNELVRKVRSGEEFTAEDTMTYTTLYKKLMNNGQEAEALELAKKVRPTFTNSGEAIQALKDLGNDPSAMIESALSDVRQGVDKRHVAKGFSDAVENAADQVGDAIKQGDVSKAKELLDKDLGAYAYGKKAQKRLAKKGIKGKEEALKLMADLGENVSNEQMLKIAGDVTDAIKKNNGVASVSDADTVKAYQLLKKAQSLDVNSREYAETTAQAAKVIGDKIPTSFGDKFKTVLYDNMLGNFRTGLTRNAGGNVVGNSLEKVQKPLRTFLDALISKETGKRNYILDKDLVEDYVSGFKKGISDQTQDVKKDIHTARSGEEYDFSKLVGENTKMFKGNNVVSKVLNGYDNAVKNAMTYGDRPFYEAEYKTAKHELEKIVDKYGEDALSLNGLPDNASVDTDDVIEILARNRALEAVYQKGTLASDGFTKLKNGLGQISESTIGTDLLSQTSMPFLQVPANTFERFVDYLPGLGTVKNTITTGKEVSHGNFNQKRFVDAMSRNLVGTGLVGLAAGMANKGKITGGYSDDKDKAAAQRAAGELEYALVMPDSTQIDISDMPVLGPMAQAGSAFNEAYQQNSDDKVNALLQGVKEGTTSALETSALQGLNRLFGTNLYSNNGGIGENVTDTVLSAFSQLIPSLVRQTAQVVDNNKRDLGEYGTAQYYLNNAINSTPLRMALLNPKIDSEGREILQNQGRNIGSKMLENYVLPYTISKPDYSAIGQAANDIYENSTDASTEGYATIPSRSTVKNWLGDDYSEGNYYNVKKEVGTYNTELGNKLVNSDFFKGLSSDEQGDALSKIYTTSKALSRMQHDPTYEADDKLVEAYMEDGADGVVEYLTKKNAFDTAEVSTSNKAANEAYEKGGKAWDNFTEMYAALKEYDYSTNDEKAVKAYKAGKLDEYASMDKVLKSYNMSASDENIDFYNSVGEKKFNEYASYVTKNGIKNNTQTRYLYQDYGIAGLKILENADADNSGTLKKTDELIPYLKKKNYSLSEANKVIESLGWADITQKQYNKY